VSERILAAELIGTELLVTVKHLSAGEAPKPRAYFAGLVAFGALSAFALVSDESAKLAAGVGGLVLLSAAIRFPEFFTWLVAAAGGPGYAPAPANNAPAVKTPPGAKAIIDGIGSIIPTPGNLNKARGWVCGNVPGAKRLPLICG